MTAGHAPRAGARDVRLSCPERTKRCGQDWSSTRNTLAPCRRTRPGSSACWNCCNGGRTGRARRLGRTPTGCGAAASGTTNQRVLLGRPPRVGPVDRKLAWCYRHRGIEQMFDAKGSSMITRRCLDCDTQVMFPQVGDATCPGCGLRMYVTEAGQVGRYPAGDWTPGGYGRQKG
jgi:hypothetical protein